MKTTREAITKINMQIDAQEDNNSKAMSEIQKKHCAKISKQIDAQEDHSKAIREKLKTVKTVGNDSYFTSCSSYWPMES